MANADLGRKKLHQLDLDLQRLVGIRNENLLCIHAIQMSIPKSHHASRLAILSEKRPPSNLSDILSDCDFFREERATVSLAATFTALRVFIAIYRSTSNTYCSVSKPSITLTWCIKVCTFCSCSTVLHMLIHMLRPVSRSHWSCKPERCVSE